MEKPSIDTTTPEYAARVILENAKRGRSGDFQADRHQAAKDLLSRFWEVAQAQGYSAHPAGDGSYVLGYGTFARVVFDLSDQGEISVAAYVPHDNSGEKKIAGLVFDPVAGVYAGADPDPDAAPSPGAAVPRLHALVVLARLVSEMLPRDMPTPR